MIPEYHTHKGNAGILTSLMPACDERRMWRERLALAFESFVDQKHLVNVVLPYLPHDAVQELMELAEKLPGLKVLQSPEGGVTVGWQDEGGQFGREVMCTYALLLRTDRQIS